MNRIEIPISRTKIILGLIGTLCFVIISLVLIFYAEILAVKKTERIPMIISVGILGFVMFGIFSLCFIKRLLSKPIQLIIDKKGLYEPNFGLIEWQDMTQIETIRIQKNRIILIHTHCPKKYLNRLSNVKMFCALINQKFYKTPLSISSAFYQCSFQQLEQFLEVGLITYQTKGND